MFKYTTASSATVILFAVAGASPAAACSGGATVDQQGINHDLSIGLSGPCNDLRTLQRNRNNDARISIEGRGTTNEVYQLGSNGALNIHVRGSRGGGIIVVQGHCSPGSAPRRVDHRADGSIDLHIPKCR